MSNIHEDSAASKTLQDDIHRERILRARAMTPDQRMAEMFRLSEQRFQTMLADAMQRLGTQDEAVGWQEVRREVERLREEEERGFYVTEKPVGK